MRTREPVLLVVVLLCGGCHAIFNGWLDPTQVGRFRERSVTQDLRRSISVADEPTTQIEATEPTAADLQVDDKDYVLRPGDLINVSIHELLGAGPWAETRQVSGEGMITLPQIRQDIPVGGKSARQLEKYITRVLQDLQIQMQPDVTVLVVEARNMTFNIIGAVSQPRSEVIPRPNFRVLDALALAGGTNPQGGPKQPLVKMAYVLRRTELNHSKDMIVSSTQEAAPNFSALPASIPAETGGHWVYTDNEWKFIQEEVKKPPQQELPKAAPAPLERKREVKETVPVIREPLTKPAIPSTEPAGEVWEQVAAQMPSQRVIAIPLDKLEIGDPRYNIVIRDGDTILIPAPIQGEFYVGGNVLRPGTFSLTGREMTIKQAIIAAGGLAPLADPSRCELVRRIDGNQEQTIAINIDRIFAGCEGDIILKPDDQINVGTNPVMPFLAVLRNAFRATYGFGFVYDRNFADIDSFNAQINPRDRRRAEQQQRFGF